VLFCFDLQTEIFTFSLESLKGHCPVKGHKICVFSKVTAFPVKVIPRQVK